MQKRICRLGATLLYIATIFTPLTACKSSNQNQSSQGLLDEQKDKKVLLVSIDGLRADAVANTEFGRYLLKNSAYSLTSTTVEPSLTLPCHMSMFYGVSPQEHGLLTNSATPTESLKDGITETLANHQKSSAIFYDWEPIKFVAKESTTTRSTYLDSNTYPFSETVTMTGDACMEHLLDSPTDFTFLYLGFPDENGHTYGWLSNEYYQALNESFSVVQQAIESINKDDYTIIITADHGGHDKTHGTTMYEDMTIPMFIIGENYTPGTNLGAHSILDIAPTIISLFGIDIPEHWGGTAIK